MEEMKICRKCKEEKPIFEYHKDKTKKYGVTTICKPCARIETRKYYKANTQHILEHQRRYSKFYIPKHTKDIDSRLKELCTKAKGRTNKEFNLVPQNLIDLWAKQDGKCAYTGLPLVPTANQFNTVSLDRVDSSKGYIVGNIQLLCTAINRMKLDYDEKVFIQFCHLVSQHNKDKEYPISLADTV